VKHLRLYQDDKNQMNDWFVFLMVRMYGLYIGEINYIQIYISDTLQKLFK